MRSDLKKWVGFSFSDHAIPVKKTGPLRKRYSCKIQGKAQQKMKVRYLAGAPRQGTLHPAIPRSRGPSRAVVHKGSQG